MFGRVALHGKRLHKRRDATHPHRPEGTTPYSQTRKLTHAVPRTPPGASPLLPFAVFVACLPGPVPSTSTVSSASSPSFPPPTLRRRRACSPTTPSGTIATCVGETKWSFFGWLISLMWSAVVDTYAPRRVRADQQTKSNWPPFIWS